MKLFLSKKDKKKKACFFIRAPQNFFIHFNSAFTQKCCNKISVHYLCNKYR